VLTQGRGDGQEWVTAFMVSYSMDAFHWKYITDVYGNQRVHTRYVCKGGSVAEWLACWTQAQTGLGLNRSRDAVG